MNDDWSRVAWQLCEALEAVYDDQRSDGYLMSEERRRQVSAAFDAYDRKVRESRHD